MVTRVGLDVLFDEQRDLIRGRRVGLVAHPASVDSRMCHAVERFATTGGIRLVALFGPEHGLRGAAAPNEAVEDAFDLSTGFPVHSLFGDDERRAPTPAQLDEIDVLVVDLQDVGARFFTYYLTAAACMRACAAAGKSMMVLDRPNPLGGRLIEGPVFPQVYAVVQGQTGLPIRHGLTMGELLRFIANREDLDVELTIVAANGWRRDWLFGRTGLSWVPPSPSLPTSDAALLFAGTGLFEGTVACEGRGTALPFEQIGAPGVVPETLARALRAEIIPGAVVRPTWFVPTTGKHSGQLCGGVQIHLLNRRLFRPVATGVTLLAVARHLYPEAFAWRPLEPDGVAWIDQLSGGPALRLALDGGIPGSDVVAGWRPGLRAFEAERQSAMLYA